MVYGTIRKILRGCKGVFGTVIECVGVIFVGYFSSVSYSTSSSAAAVSIGL